MKIMPKEIQQVQGTLEDVSIAVRELLDRHDESSVIASLIACVGVMMLDNMEGNIKEVHKFFKRTYSEQSLLELKSTMEEDIE